MLPRAGAVANILAVALWQLLSMSESPASVSRGQAAPSLPRSLLVTDLPDPGSRRLPAGSAPRGPAVPGLLGVHNDGDLSGPAAPASEGNRVPAAGAGAEGPGLTRDSFAGAEPSTRSPK